jgi:hypothetical protein
MGREITRQVGTGQRLTIRELPNTEGVLNSRKGHLILIRSTDVWNDSRTMRILETAKAAGLRVSLLRWNRLGRAWTYPGVSVLEFDEQAPYGSGVRSLNRFARWCAWVMKTLRELPPGIVYACDLDAALPAVFGRAKHEMGIFDEFDPITARLPGRISGVTDHDSGISKSVMNQFRCQVFPSVQRYRSKSRCPHVVPNVPNRLGDAASARVSSRNLSYVGALFEDRGLRHVLNAVLQSGRWTWKIAGQGPLGDVLAIPRDRIQFVGPVMPEEGLRIQASSALIAAMYAPSRRHNRLTASNKMLEAAALQRPLLTSRGTRLATEVQRLELGYTVEYGSVSAILKALDGAAADRLWTDTDFHKRCVEVTERFGWPYASQELQRAMSHAGWMVNEA